MQNRGFNYRRQNFPGASGVEQTLSMQNYIFFCEL